MERKGPMTSSIGSHTGRLAGCPQRCTTPRNKSGNFPLRNGESAVLLGWTLLHCCSIYQISDWTYQESRACCAYVVWPHGHLQTLALQHTGNEHSGRC